MLLRARRARDITLLDRVYEHITLPPLIVAVVDTTAFQRLRGLHQLGASSYLYPGAVHTRFEHSIGVAHMARVLLRNIQRNQPELRITEHDILTCMLAGLCHDLGHGPFSHLFEDVVSHRCGLTFNHEDMSEQLTRRTLAPLVSAEDVESVVQIMRGYVAGSSASSSSLSLLPYGEIVSNKRNGIDVDKMDYFIRDSLCCFGKPTVDVRVHRLFHSARLVRGPDGQWQMAFEEKLALSLREFFTLRAKLHKNVYQHQVTKAIGHMIGDALHLALPHFRIAGHTMDDCVRREDLFVHLGDWILDAIAADDSPSLQPARAIIHRLRTRRIYHTVFASAMDMQHVEAAKGVDWSACILAHADPSMPAVRAEMFIAEVVVINHGQGASDPLKRVLFFNPKRPQQSAASVLKALEGHAQADTARGALGTDAAEYAEVGHTNDTRDVGVYATRHAGSSLFTPLSFEERTLMVFEREDSGGAVARACARMTADTTLAHFFTESLPFYNSK